MVRNVHDINTKVLNECLRKNVQFGILQRHAYSELPPRLECRVTRFGTKLIRILDELEKLQSEIDNDH